jgi:hypothetical protein
MREIAETGGEGDGADGRAGMARIAERAMGAGEARAEHELRERHAFTLEQALDVAPRELVAHRQRRQRKIALVEMRDDVGLDRREPIAIAMRAWTWVATRWRNSGVARGRLSCTIFR